MITIDWDARIINVPRADMPIVQTTPMEVRELDLDTFRLALKALEASDDGVAWPDTHIHYAGVSVGGVDLAMVISIINGYTVTFEDGQYAVNLVGANSNVGDQVNPNNVSIRSANSAGLVVVPGLISPTDVADAVWDKVPAPVPGSYGDFVKNKLLSVAKFLALK